MDKKGFTLIEILVAVGIIFILLALVLPNVWRARVDSNESIAVSNLKTLNSALQMYYLDNEGFPEDLSELTPPESSLGYVDQKLADGSEAGYNFSYSYQDSDSFYITADPRRIGKTGNRYFCIDDRGIVHYNDESTASTSDPTLK